MLDLKKLKIADDFDDGLKGQKVFDIVRFDNLNQMSGSNYLIWERVWKVLQM